MGASPVCAPDNFGAVTAALLIFAVSTLLDAKTCGVTTLLGRVSVFVEKSSVFDSCDAAIAAEAEMSVLTMPETVTVGSPRAFKLFGFTSSPETKLAAGFVTLIVAIVFKLRCGFR
jgi:hypothetical protein